MGAAPAIFGRLSLRRPGQDPVLMLLESLSHYHILSRLGAGGMGEVFLAEDSRLHRRVALKVLSDEIARDRDSLRRFEQEAFAASALNHPNILTIHEFGEAGGVYYLATEFVDGETLRQMIRGGDLSLDDALDIAEQTAFALSAAHAAGIVHRDLKPENIMVRRDRVVKVLDFGLAKLVEKKGLPLDTEARTPHLVRTNPGAVIGTVLYMSPEQARAKDTDERTDIWSLGVVLYEMLTRRLPFAGETTSDTMAAILTTEPRPLADYVSDVPAELQHIVGKALRKQREERYQDVKDLRIDLRDLRHELALQQDLERSGAPHQSDSETQVPSAGREDGPHATEIAGVKRAAVRAAVAALALLLAVAGLGYWSVEERDRQPAREARLPFQKRTVTRVAVSGNAIDVAISPDGKFIAYVTQDDNRYGLWLKQAAIATSNVQIVPPSEGEFRGVTFSPDGQFLYYAKITPPSRYAVLYQTPALGGDTRRLNGDVGSQVSFSPDGRQISFIRYDGAPGETALVLANADGSGERRLATRMKPRYFSTPLGPAWSPDGKVIACPANDRLEGNPYGYIVTVDVATGEERQLTPPRFNDIGKFAWMSDGSGLVMRAAEAVNEFDAQQLLFVAYPGGDVRRITGDPCNYRTVSLTSDSRTLATIVEENESAVWLAPDGDSARARRLSSNPSNLDGKYGLSWAPDGRLVFYSHASGQDAVWTMDADGSNRRQLTDDSNASYSAVVSPDGRYIVFQSERTGGQNLWRMDIDGSNPTQLTSGFGLPGEFTPDGQWFVYETYETGFQSTWKVPIAGGEPVQLSESDRVTRRPCVLPDGKLVAVCYKAPGEPWKVALIPIEGGGPVKLFDIPPTIAADLIALGFQWTSERRVLTYVRGGTNVWLLPLDFASRPRQLTSFSSEAIFWYQWSRDGKTLAISRGSTTRDVVLIGEEAESGRR